MLTVAGRTGARLAGLLWGLWLHASLCSSLAASAAADAGRGAGVHAGAWGGGSMAGAHARVAGGHAPASCAEAEDSMEDVKLHLGQIDEIVEQMSQFQVHASPPASCAALKPV